MSDGRLMLEVLVIAIKMAAEPQVWTIGPHRMSFLFLRYPLQGAANFSTTWRRRSPRFNEFYITEPASEAITLEPRI